MHIWITKKLKYRMNKKFEKINANVGKFYNEKQFKKKSFKFRKKLIMLKIIFYWKHLRIWWIIFINLLN